MLRSLPLRKVAMGDRLKLARGNASIEVKQVVAELFDDGTKDGQCWIYSRKNTPFGCLLN